MHRLARLFATLPKGKPPIEELKMAAGTAKAMRKKPQRSKKQLMYPGVSETKSCVVAVPFASRCDDVELEKPGPFSSTRICDRDLHVLPDKQQEGLDEELKESFVFGDQGIVVFWNFDKQERDELLQRIPSSTRLPARLMEHEKEIIPIAHSTQGRDIFHDNPTFRILSSIQNDQVVLSNIHSGSTTYSNDSVFERFALSHGIALSVKLGVFEERFRKIIDPEDSKAGLDDIAEEMEKQGRISLGKSEVIRKIGLLYKLRHELGQVTHLQDDSEVFWERTDLDSLRKNAANSLDVPIRIKSLQTDLDYHLDFYKLLDEILRDEHGSRLEKIIIAFIGIEIVLEVIHMMM